jgi:hypothetical protein
VQNGVIREQDVAAMMKKKGEQGLSGLALLTELLRSRNLLSANRPRRGEERGG